VTAYGVSKTLPKQPRPRERGGAVVEFTLVSALLVTLFLAVLQIGLVIHVRNTLVASAAEGARYAANANRGLDDGRLRTRSLIAEALSPRFAGEISSRMVDIGGAATVEVTVTTTLPVVGLLGPARALTVSGHAVAEPAL
jgi:Flp pilus assembly protein TadG